MGKVIPYNFRKDRFDKLDQLVMKRAEHLTKLLEPDEPEPDLKNYKGTDWSEVA